MSLTAQFAELESEKASGSSVQDGRANVAMRVSRNMTEPLNTPGVNRFTGEAIGNMHWPTSTLRQRELTATRQFLLQNGTGRRQTGGCVRPSSPTLSTRILEENIHVLTHENMHEADR